MGRLYRNALIVIAVLVFLGQAMFPMEKSLRRGKDLAGGVTLTYSVTIAPGEDRKAVMDRTIDTLKRRIDPGGVMEISIVPQGTDRLEISMPLPSESVKGMRKKLDDALAELGKSQVTEARLSRAMSAEPAARSRELADLSRGDATLTGLLNGLAGAYDAFRAARGVYDAEADAAKKEALAPGVASAELEYDRAKREVLKSVVSAAEMKRVLELSTKSRTLFDEETKKPVTMSSPREQAIERLLQAHPGAKDEIDRVVHLHEDYTKARTTLDDPQDLIRIVEGAGVLTFRITCNPGQHPEETRLRSEIRERGPRNVRSADAGWYKLNDLTAWYNDVGQFKALQADPQGFFRGMGYVVEPYDGEYFMLAWDTRQTRLTTAEGKWGVAQASPSRDQMGRPSIAFRMSSSGASLLGALTRDNVGQKMAVLLDDQVYTAPTLRSAISRDGEITGDFPQEEVDYIVRVLAAGSLDAKLSKVPLSIDSVGPELGADNLQRGLRAGLISLALISGFMVVYYFGAGLIAVITLACTAILILGAMSLQHAAFTMAGIAGVILTFGMAVDANVLIYERIREELGNGNDLRTAVRLGFDKALSSIVDGNITTLIVCVVLASKQVSTPEIRGFGITMGIGVLATLFSGLFVTRLLFDVLVQVVGLRKMRMLPTVVPVLQRALTPNINWMGLRWVFIGLSTAYVLLGLGMVAARGKEMLSTQFVGGTAVTLDFRRDEDGNRLTMSRAEVLERVRAVGEKSDDGEIRKLAKADVFPLNPGPDGVTASSFRVATESQSPQRIVDAVVGAFTDKLDAPPVMSFAGVGGSEIRRAPVFTIDRGGAIGAMVDMPGVSADASAYLGGAAVVLKDLEPRPTLESLRSRLEKVRGSSAYSDTLSRARDVLVAEGDERAVRTAIVLVRDDEVSAFEDVERHESEVKVREWNLANTALASKVTPASVQSIGSVVAGDFVTRAISATIISFLGITIYIWVRFKAFRYSLAAIVALLHDVLTVLGMVALSGWLVSHTNEGVSAFASRLGLMDFKIDLNLVAAMLTVAGYSLNDTVIVMDRIREYRGKMKFASKQMINNAINHTISRTIITGGTTLVAALILYLWGGEGVRAFSFALLVGLTVGTYSSIAVASPLVWSRRGDVEEAEAMGGAGQPAAG